MSELSIEQVERILQGVRIPPQPQIMVDLQMEQLMPDCSVDRIARLISQDVGLAGAILKTVNSPFYGLSNRISSIQQAAALLGIKTLVNLVNAHSIKASLSDEDVVSLSRFWDSAMDVAMAANMLARQLGHSAPDEAYTLGLFHNCGIPLLMARFPDYPAIMQEAYCNPDGCLVQLEDERLSTNHAIVGYYVAKAWNLPERLCNAIHGHHNLQQILSNPRADSGKKVLLCILKMAEHCCNTYRILGNQSEDHEWQSLQGQVLEIMGLSGYDFESLKNQVEEMGLGSGSYYC